MYSHCLGLTTKLSFYGQLLAQIALLSTLVSFLQCYSLLLLYFRQTKCWR